MWARYELWELITAVGGFAVEQLTFDLCQVSKEGRAGCLSLSPRVPGH